MNTPAHNQSSVHLDLNRDGLLLVDEITQMTGYYARETSWLGIVLIQRILQRHFGAPGWTPPLQLFADGRTVSVWVGELPKRHPLGRALIGLVILGSIAGAFMLGLMIG